MSASDDKAVKHDTVSGFSDEEIVGYCAIHCRTDVALFHRGQMLHLAQVAGCPEVVREGWAWGAFGPETVDPLVAKARENLRK